MKRLAAGFAIAARQNEYGARDERDVPHRVGEAYREAMAHFAKARYIGSTLKAEFEAPLGSVPDDIDVLLRRYSWSDLAIKVVGVDSVETRCFIVLMRGRDGHEPFFLQIKEAGRSVLEDHLPDNAHAERRRRVVEGQPLMQSTSDSFLGWHVDGLDKHDYWRQVKDMKGSVAAFTDAIRDGRIQAHE